MLVAAENAFRVSPGIGLVVAVAVSMIALACLPVVVAKARWGWLIVGLLTGGLGWIIGALQPALPQSLLSRWRSRSA